MQTIKSRNADHQLHALPTPTGTHLTDNITVGTYKEVVSERRLEDILIRIQRDLLLVPPFFLPVPPQSNRSLKRFPYTPSPRVQMSLKPIPVP
jgi:hypothetical protein